MLDFSGFLIQLLNGITFAMFLYLIAAGLSLVFGVINALTPPAIAASHSPDQIERHAREMATKAEEQAVSTAMLGPFQSNM